MSYHVPVLTREVVTWLAPVKNGIYVDATFGGGGHSRAILEAEPTCQVIAFDWDRQALEMNAIPLEEEFPKRFTWVWANFSQLSLQLKKLHVKKINGLLADFGTSQYQILHRDGFSFVGNTPLDMRMSPAHQHTTAAMLIRELSEHELAEIFWLYGEERHARALAQAIVIARKQKPITTTGELAHIVSSKFPRSTQRIHPATRIFQALRIAVNKELDNIHALLSQLPDLLAPKGRLVCISFHSLEDRLVKQFFRDHPQDFKILTPHIIMAQQDELMRNPSARSAKLRAAEKID